jgi:hypothetical protein
MSNSWSKITIPLWNSVSVLFGVDSTDINNPKLKIDFLIDVSFLKKGKFLLVQVHLSQS